VRADSREERKLIRVSIDTGAGFLLRLSRQDLLSEKAKHVLETSSRAIFSRASADAPCHFRARGDAEPSVDEDSSSSRWDARGRRAGRIRCRTREHSTGARRREARQICVCLGDVTFVRAVP
jgi:hypothetical protein